MESNCSGLRGLQLTPVVQKESAAVSRAVKSLSRSTTGAETVHVWRPRATILKHTWTFSESRCSLLCPSCFENATDKTRGSKYPISEASRPKKHAFHGSWDQTSPILCTWTLRVHAHLGKNSLIACLPKPSFPGFPESMPGCVCVCVVETWSEQGVSNPYLAHPNPLFLF